jgi:hypothetical protein
VSGHNADDRLREPAKASPNFGRLYRYQPLLALYGSQAELTVPLNEKTLRSRYPEITRRRNKIAHDADLIDGDLKQRRPIDEAGVNDAIDWIERIALAITHMLDDQE